MKKLSLMTISTWVLFVATACIIAWGVFYMNWNGIGYGSNRTFALPLAVMVVMLYSVLILVLVEEMSPRGKLAVAISGFVISSMAVLF